MDISAPDPGKWVDALLRLLHELPAWAELILIVLVSGLAVRWVLVPLIRALRR